MQSDVITKDKLFSTLFENTQDGIVIYDFSFRIIAVNKAMEGISGYSKEEITGRNIADFVHREDYELWHMHLQQAKIFSHGKVHCTKVYHKSGGTRIVEASEVLIPYNEETVILSTIRDVTEWHETRDALEKQKQLSEAILKSLPCIYYVIEVNENFEPLLVIWNQNLETATKLTPEELLHKNILEFFNEEEQALIKREIGLLMSGKKKFFTNVLNPILGDGKVERYYYQTVAFNSEGKTYYLGTGIDISEKRDLERMLIESVIQTEETERRRISSDLHNGLGADLSTIKLYIQGLLDSKDADTKLCIGDKLYMLIDEAVDSISDIAFNISPHFLLEYGLVAAVEAFIARLRFQETLTLNFESDDFDRFEINKEVTLYRTITELINNTLKHADAEKIHLEMRMKKGELLVLFSDDGRGFDMGDSMSGLKGMGLKNMKSRMESLGGTFSMTARIGKGMKAKITLPNTEHHG